MKKNLKVICLMGPTVSGKTTLAIELLKQLPVDIVSVDSAMVYRKMDIGTAKPTQAILTKAPHRLINIREPHETYSVAIFCDDVHREIESILEVEKIPLLVGGTMLYFHALQRGLSELPNADPHVRKDIEKQAESVGWAALHERLQTLDPRSAERIKPTDIQRIQRALEVYEITGKPLSTLWQQSKLKKSPYAFINIGLIPRDRQHLHEEIAKRFDHMLAQGFVEEVKQLYRNKNITSDLPAMRAVGYRQILSYLQGEISYDEMRNKAIIATRQLAKRQMTWLRSFDDLNEFDCYQEDLLESVLSLLHKKGVS